MVEVDKFNEARRFFQRLIKSSEIDFKDEQSDLEKIKTIFINSNEQMVQLITKISIQYIVGLVNIVFNDEAREAHFYNLFKDKNGKNSKLFKIKRTWMYEDKVKQIENLYQYNIKLTDNSGYIIYLLERIIDIAIWWDAWELNDYVYISNRHRHYKIHVQQKLLSEYIEDNLNYDEPLNPI